MAPRGYVGTPESFDARRIDSLVGTGKVRNRTNLEKALWALELTAQLEDLGLDFVLKGGTAVQLVTDPAWPRFSVDVDIFTGAGKGDIEETLGRIGARFEGDGFRVEPRAVKALDPSSFSSYRVTTPPIEGRTHRILIDAHLTTPRLVLQETPLRSFFYGSAISVRAPTVGSLIGDKLSILAPRTVGRKFIDSRQGLEYIKHLFDIHRLLGSAPTGAHIWSALRMSIEEQAVVRGERHTIGEVVEDIVTACETVATLALPPGWEPRYAPELPLALGDMRRMLRSGVKDLRPSLVGGTSFGTEEVVTAAGEAALLALMAREGDGDLDALGAITGVDGRGGDHEAVRTEVQGYDGEDRWFIDTGQGLYTPRALSIWNEVLRRTR